MKTLIFRLRNSRGMTLIELIATCALLSIVMLAIFSFITFSTDNVGTTLQNTSTQNEIRLMMLHIENEVIPAIGGKITDDASILALGGPGDTDTRLLFGFSGGRFQISARTPGKLPETIHEYIEIPDLSVTFKMHSELENILIVGISTESDDPRFNFGLMKELLLPNLGTGYGSPIDTSEIVSASVGGNSLLVITPNPLPID